MYYCFQRDCHIYSSLRVWIAKHENLLLYVMKPTVPHCHKHFTAQMFYTGIVSTCKKKDEGVKDSNMCKTV